MCVLAYYCLFHRNTPRSPIFLFCGVNQGSERSFYTLQSLNPPRDYWSVNLGLHATHCTKRAHLCKEKHVTKHDVQPALLCFNLLVRLFARRARVLRRAKVTLTPGPLSCNSGIYSEYLRNIQYFSGRSRPRVRNRTPPRHTLTPTREHAGPVQRGAERTAGKERKGERSAWRFCVT